MEKLELKHIVPHGIADGSKLYFSVSQKYKGDWIGKLTDIDFINRTVKIKGVGDNSLAWKYQPLSNVKPILRPLSDLTKPICHKGEEFVPIVEILKEEHHSWYLEIKNTRYDEIEYAINGMKVEAWFSISAGHRSSLHTGFIHNWPLWVVEKLLEWHFDIHGLIEKGLAIDVNTLEVNPYK